MEEFLDILDEKGRPISRRSYGDAHKEGLLHKAVHVWIINEKKQLLIQKRSPQKQAYPNYWDTSAAGHVSSGETSVQAAQKETREELGLSLPESAFSYLFSLEEHIVLNHGTFVNNEIQDVYLVRLKDSPSLILQKEEVAETIWIDAASFADMTKNKKVPFVPHKDEYKRLIETLTRLV